MSYSYLKVEQSSMIDFDQQNAAQWHRVTQASREPVSFTLDSFEHCFAVKTAWVSVFLGYKISQQDW